MRKVEDRIGEYENKYDKNMKEALEKGAEESQKIVAKSYREMESSHNLSHKGVGDPYLGQEYHQEPTTDKIGPWVDITTNPPVEMPPAGHPRFYEILDDMRKLHDNKNADYAGGGQEGALGNFVRVSKIKKMYPDFNWSSPFGVAVAYYLKQFDAVMHMYEQQKGSSVGEGIPERLMDMATYAPLMIILLEETEGKSKNQKLV